MKKFFFILIPILFGCSKGDIIDVSRPCSSVSNFSDTLEVDNYRLKLIGTISTTKTGALELVDLNLHKISESSDFRFIFVQLQNGDNCWETPMIHKRTGDSDNVFCAVFYNVPDWAINSNTKVKVKVKIQGNYYYIKDNDLTKSKSIVSYRLQ